MNCYPQLVIAGTHSGVGKTTVTLAIMAPCVCGAAWCSRLRRGLILSIPGITGQLPVGLRRGTQETLIGTADLVTGMKQISHLFGKEIKVQPEVEY